MLADLVSSPQANRFLGKIRLLSRVQFPVGPFAGQTPPGNAARKASTRHGEVSNYDLNHHYVSVMSCMVHSRSIRLEGYGTVFPKCELMNLTGAGANNGTCSGRRSANHGCWRPVQKILPWYAGRDVSHNIDTEMLS
jgi:hypothetical protein